MTRVLITILLLIRFTALFSQNNSLSDSLRHSLSVEKVQELRLSILEELAFNQVHPDSILKYAAALLEEASKVNAFRSVVIAHSYSGDAYRLRGEYDSAFKSLFTALSIVDNHQIVGSDIFCRIADTYSIIGDGENSTRYYKACIDKMTDSGQGLNYGQALFNLGDDYLQANSPDSADIYNTKALVVFEQEDFEIGLIYTFGNKGLIEAQRENYEAAVNNLSKAIALLEEYEIYDAIADYQLGMAKVLLEKQEYGLAQDYASQALEMSHKGDYKEGIKNAAQLLSAVYEKLNDIGEAFNFLKMYMSYKDSTQSTSILQRMEESRRNYVVSKSKTREAGSAPEASFIVDKPRYYAVLFGVNDYEFNDDKLTDLDQPIENINSLYNSLTKKYQFDESNTLLLPNPSRADIINTMEMLSEITTERDNLLLFYAGHGVYDEKLSIGYWLPSDAKSFTKSNWVSNSVMRDYVAGIEARHILLVSDACFSGSIFKSRGMMQGLGQSAVSKLYKLNSRKAMTSGTLNTVPDQSVFMSYLIKGLEDNDNEFLSTRELFNLILPSVLNNTHNTPQYGIMHNTGDSGGEFIFIRTQAK